MPLPDKFTVSGTPEQIAMQLPILQAMYLGFKELEVSGGGSNRPPVSPEFKDWLRLSFYWGGVVDGTNTKHTVDKSVRLVGVDPATRDLAYFQNLARQVMAKFRNHSFKTGRIFCKYTKWKDGFQTYGYFDNYTTGYNLVESIGDIVGKSIDRKLFKYEYRLDPAEAFDPTPSKVTVAGKLVRPPARGQVATVKWSSARILFPYIGHEAELCNASGKMIQDLNFLNKYD